MKKISTLIIDMYGVILKERTGNFPAYTYDHFDHAEHPRIKHLLEIERLYTKAGLGDITSDEFLSWLGYGDPEHHMRQYIETYLTFDRTFIPLAEKYSQQYRFVLLSTDVSEWSRYITAHYGMDRYFAHRVVSGDVHCRKPDPKIYEITLERAGVGADECLFVDDSINNILAAEKLGIGTVLFNRFNEPYPGRQVSSFAELDGLLESLDK